MLKKVYEQIHAVQNAQKNNEKIMRLVHSVDETWLEEWNKPLVPLTEEQLQQVHAFWDKYSFAYENNPRFQEHFTNVSGQFNPRYCPPGLNIHYMYRFYDSAEYHTAFHDKNYREFIFRDFPHTNAVIHRVRGLYYDKEFNPISYNVAMSALERLVSSDRERLIVKPTPGGGGDGIQFIRKGDSIDDIACLLDSFKKDDLIIEHFLGSHPTYAAANATSLNTLRIITMLYENEFSVIAVLFRMGAEGNEVDNFTQGGIACGVTLDGVCMDYGFDHFGKRYDRHPNGFEFSGHQLFGVSEAVELTGRLHRRVPQFKQMSWDIAVDENGVPTLIEMNPRGDGNIYQSIGVLPFGEKTEQILDEFLITRFYKRGANHTWSYNEYNDHVVLTGCALNKSVVKVPEKIADKYVTHIASGCFTGNKITEIIVPGSVKSFDDGICTDGINAHITYLPDKRDLVPPAVVKLSGALKLGRNSLTWEPVEGATHYYIYRMKQNETRQWVKTVSAVVTSFDDYNIIEGAEYFYYVRSYDSRYNIYSDWGEPVALKAGIELSAPADFRVEVSSGQNELSWQPVSGVTHYHVFRKQGEEEELLLRRLPAGKTSVCDCDIQNGVSYTYYVRGYNAKYATYGGVSEAITVEGLIEIPYPASIRGKVRSGQNILTWEAEEKATFYYVYRMEQGGTREFMQVLPANATTYVDRDIRNDVVYYYYVRSYNAGLDIMSDWSAPVAIRGMVQIPCPESIQGKVGFGQNSLTWEPVKNAKLYYVYRMEQGGTREFMQVLPANATTYVDHNVRNDVVYYYYVRSYNAEYDVMSDWSAPVAIRGMVQIPCPESMRGKVVSGQNILSWEPVKRAKLYYVYRMEQGGTREFMQVLPANATTYVDRDIRNDVVYYYYVRSYNAEYDVMSDWSAPVAIRGQVQLPCPTAIRGKAVPGQNNLYWEPVEGATHYYIYRMKQGEAREFLRAVPAETNFFGDEGVEADAVYYYYIRSKSAKHDVMSAWSESVAVKALGDGA